MCCVCSVALSCPTLCGSLDWAHQTPLSMEFSRQEYWRGLPFPPPGGLSDPGIKPASPVPSALAGGFFKPPGKPPKLTFKTEINVSVRNVACSCNGVPPITYQCGESISITRGKTCMPASKYAIPFRIIFFYGTNILNCCLWLPSGPVVKNLPSNAGDAGSIPGRGTKIPHAAG